MPVPEGFVSGLDPLASLVLDLRDLGRRAGSMLNVSRTVLAPAELGDEVVGIPAGSDMELQVRLESVEEGVLVTGSVSATVQGSCSRCLDPISFELVEPVQELYCYPDGEHDEELRWVQGDTIDLEPALRDAVVLDLPLAPVCREDCPGLCPQCGARLAEDPTHQHETSDPRWAGLVQLLDPGRDAGAETKEEA